MLITWSFTGAISEVIHYTKLFMKKMLKTYRDDQEHVVYSPTVSDLSDQDDCPTSMSTPQPTHPSVQQQTIIYFSLNSTSN